MYTTAGFNTQVNVTILSQLCIHLQVLTHLGECDHFVAVMYSPAGFNTPTDLGECDHFVTVMYSPAGFNTPR